MIGLVMLSCFLLPLSDEIVGAFQFRKLCRDDAVARVDAARIRGRQVRVVTDPANQEVKGKAVRILYSLSKYSDAWTNEEFGFSGRYVANGGWLIRLLSDGGFISPLLFASTCGDGIDAFEYGFFLVR
jgi:hypothetical protein